MSFPVRILKDVMNYSRLMMLVLDWICFTSILLELPDSHEKFERISHKILFSKIREKIVALLLVLYNCITDSFIKISNNCRWTKFMWIVHWCLLHVFTASSWKHVDAYLDLFTQIKTSTAHVDNIYVSTTVLKIML
jgi:hypothetical protein